MLNIATCPYQSCYKAVVPVLTPKSFLLISVEQIHLYKNAPIDFDCSTYSYQCFCLWRCYISAKNFLQDSLYEFFWKCAVASSWVKKRVAKPNIWNKKCCFSFVHSLRFSECILRIFWELFSQSNAPPVDLNTLRK